MIEHLENLEISLPDEPISKKEKSKDAPDTTSILKKKTNENSKVHFDKEARDQTQKSCELYKAMKLTDNPAWKAHKTSKCRSKEY